MNKPDPAAEELIRIDQIVSRACKLHRRIKTDQEQLDELKAELIELAPGRYLSEDGESVTISAPAPSLKPGASQITAARALAKDKADLIFERVAGYKAVTGFREICRAVFTPARAEKIIALCEVPSAPQVRF